MSVTKPFRILETKRSGKPLRFCGFWSDAKTTDFALFKKKLIV